MTLSPGANIIKLFSAVIYKFLKYVIVLVRGKPFQPVAMFAGKAEAYLGKAPFKCSTLGQALAGLSPKY